MKPKNLETKKEADALLGKLDGQTFVVIRSASDSGALYGSVSPRDAAEVATSAGFSIDRKQISLVKPIKELGLHEMSVVLHPEVTATIILNVARSTEEADLQASGKSIQDVAAEAEAEAEFEIAELFDDIGSAALDDDNEDDQVSDAPVEEAQKKAHLNLYKSLCIKRALKGSFFCVLPKKDIFLFELLLYLSPFCNKINKFR